jgi:apolipoprotein N-acyltransferase
MTDQTLSEHCLPIKPWQFWFLSGLSGLILMFSWPNIWLASFTAWPSALAWIAFVPYIYIWRRVGWRGAFAHAWVLGFIYFLSVLAWIRLINRDTNLDNSITWLIFTFSGAIYVGLFGATSKYISDRLKWPETLVLPLAWTTWEYLRGHLMFGGWPWGSLGHTQYSNVVIRQLASVVGVGGLSFLVMWVNVVIARELEQGLQAKTWSVSGFWARWWRPADWKEQWGQQPLITAAKGIMAGAWVFFLVLAVVEGAAFARAPQQFFKIALVQGNIDTTQHWDRAYKIKIMERMHRLHTQAASAKPDLVIWSESCFPGILEYPDEQEWETQLRTLIKNGGVPTLLTSNEYQLEKIPGEDDVYHHFNSAFLLDGQGQTLGRYRKIKLVPFGEYIPWEILKNFLHAVVREPIPVDFEPGREYASIQYGALRFSPLICYEDHFEELGYQLAKRGARFFAGLANDRWAGTSAMSYQHTAMSAFLAIEHRVYMAKANMTGPTCMISPWGTISRPLPYFKEGVKFETVAYSPGYKTFFTRFGNVVVFSMLVMFFALLAWAFFRR